MQSFLLFLLLLFILPPQISAQNVLVFTTNSAPESTTGCNITVIKEIEDDHGKYFAGETQFKIICQDYFDVDQPITYIYYYLKENKSRVVLYRGTQPSVTLKLLEGEHIIMADIQDSVGMKVTTVVGSIKVLPMRVDFAFIEDSLNSALDSNYFTDPAQQIITLGIVFELSQGSNGTTEQKSDLVGKVAMEMFRIVKTSSVEDLEAVEAALKLVTSDEFQPTSQLVELVARVAEEVTHQRKIKAEQELEFLGQDSPTVEETKSLVEAVATISNVTTVDPSPLKQKDMEEINISTVSNIAEELMEKQHPDTDPIEVVTDTLSVKVFKGERYNQKNQTFEVNGTTVVLPEGLGDKGTVKGVTIVVLKQNPLKGANKDDLIFLTPFINITIHDLWKKKIQKNVPITLKMPRQQLPQVYKTKVHLEGQLMCTNVSNSEKFGWRIEKDKVQEMTINVGARGQTIITFQKLEKYIEKNIEQQQLNDEWEQYRQAVLLRFGDDNPVGGVNFCMMPKLPVVKHLVYNPNIRIQKRVLYTSSNRYIKEHEDFRGNVALYNDGNRDANITLQIAFAYTNQTMLPLPPLQQRPECNAVVAQRQSVTLDMRAHVEQITAQCGVLDEVARKYKLAQYCQVGTSLLWLLKN